MHRRADARQCKIWGSDINLVGIREGDWGSGRTGCGRAKKLGSENKAIVSAYVIAPTVALGGVFWLKCMLKGHCGGPAIARRFRGQKKQKMLKDADDLDSFKSLSSSEEARLLHNAFDNATPAAGAEAFKTAAKVLTRRSSLSEDEGFLVSRDTPVDVVERRQVIYVKNV